MKDRTVQWLLLLGALNFPMATASQQQIPLALHQQDEYYIGMDLSASYGAVAVAFDNDTIQSIARVEGSEEYKTLLAKLAWQEHWEPPPLWPRADPHQVAVLGQMIKDLKIQAQDYLGVKINGALVATPALPYLYDITLNASIDDAGLEDMDHTYLGFIFKQPQGAMAGWGMGMCHTYWDDLTCRRESYRMPVKSLITILYTSNALCVGEGDSKGIYGYQPIHSYPSSMDFTLGYNERNHNPNETFYWTAVRERIMRGIIGGVQLAPRNHTIFVHGDEDAVGDPQFRRVLEEAIHDLLEDDPPIHYPDDPQFLVARGAALLVRRGGYS